MTVTTLSEETEKYKDTVGTYNIIPEEIYNDRPVWKIKNSKDSNVYLFSSGTYITKYSNG